MLEDIPWNDIFAKGGPVGLISLTVWMLLTGRLVPRYFYQQKVDECNSWKAAAQEGQNQSAQLLEYAKTADAILKALPRGGARNEVD